MGVKLSVYIYKYKCTHICICGCKYTKLQWILGHDKSSNSLSLSAYVIYSLLEKKVVTPPSQAIKSVWIEFLCFRGGGGTKENWHDIYLWLLPNETRTYLGRTFSWMPSGMGEVQNHSLVGNFPKFTFALWQVQISICIFSQFSQIVLIMSRPPPIYTRH